MIMNRREFRNAIDQLTTFCKEIGIKPDSFASMAQLYNHVLFYSRENSLTFSLEPKIQLHCRTALLADIHGNWEALEAVLQDIEKRNCERIVCLGDIVDGGDGDENVIQNLIERGVVMIRGNHDDYPPMMMDPVLQEHLTSLPKDIVEDDIIFIHISPREKELPIKNPIDAWNVFDETDWRIMFIGHLHYTVVFGANGGSSCSAENHSFEYNTPYKLDLDDRYIICPGPIGYSRDDVDKIRYGIYDSKENTIEIRLVDGPLLKIEFAG